MSDLLKSFQKAPTTATSQPATPLEPKDKLKTLMREQSYSLLKAMMTWAVVYERMKNGEKVEWSDDVRNVMMAPFNFFGQNMQLFTMTANTVVPVLMHGVMQYETDAVYAKANPMPWIVLSQVAPMLAQFDFGPTAMRECMIVVGELQESGELPD